MIQTADVVELLGGDANVGSRVRSLTDLAEAIDRGLSVDALRHAVRALGEPESTVVGRIGLSRTTLSRRKKRGRLGAIESELAVRLARIGALGRVVLGPTKAAGRWLLRPNDALGGRVPLDLLRSDIGTQQVEAVLGRALYGAYS